MTTRHKYRRASHKSLGALLLTSILVACANGGALDDTSGDSTGTQSDSGAVLSDDGGDEGSTQIQSDGGRPTSSDSGGTFTQDSGGNPQPDAAPGQDAAPPPPPPQDAAPPPVDAAPPPQDAAPPPPPPDSGPLCNHPSGSTCGVDPQCGCASGQSCDMTTPTSTSCVGSGSGGQYANCSTTSDCQAGYTCANDSLGSFCGRWCIVGGAGQCGSGLTCTSFNQKHTYNGTEYGVCY